MAMTGFLTSARLLLRDVTKHLEPINLQLISAGVAFFCFLAIFPALAAVIAIWGFVADPAVIIVQLETIQDFLPAEAFDLLQAQVNALIAANDSTLGWATTISLAVALWSARAGVAAIIQGINAIFGVPDRSGVGHLLLSILLTLVLVAVVLVALLAVIVVPLVLAFVPLGPIESTLIWLAKWSVSPLIIIFGTGLIYRYGPNLKRRRPGWVTHGLGVALAIWLVASVAFSFYLTNFHTYNQVYGSIGAVIALLMWFYISAYAVLIGAALNATIADRRLAQAQ